MNSCQNLLIGLAIGDAFGMGYEMLDYRTIRKELDFSRYRKNPKPNWGNGAGCYTDDTQMSIAIAELLLTRNPLTKDFFADAFVKTFKRDPRPNGYGKGLKMLLPEVSSGAELLQKIQPGSIRNGAAMRATPLGVLKDTKAVLEAALINAEATHDTLKGRASSACMALAAHYFLYGLGPRGKAFDYCLELTHGIDSESTDYWKAVSQMRTLDHSLLFGEEYKDFGTPCRGMQTVGAVLYLVSRFSDTATILKEAVLLGGDTDSVAALATGLMAILDGTGSLPVFLFRDLENGPYGRDYLLDLGERLNATYF